MRVLPAQPDQRLVSATVIVLSVIITAGVGLAIALLGPIYGIGIALALGVASLAIVRIEWVMLGGVFARSFVNLLPVSLVALPGTRSHGFADLGALIVLGVVLGGFAYVLAHRVDVFKFPVTMPFLLLTVAGFLSLVESTDKLVTLDNIVKILSYLALFAAFASLIRRPHQVTRLLVIFVIAGLLLVAFGLQDLRSGNPRTLEFQELTGLPRLEGVFSSGLGFGTALVIPMLVSLTMFLEVRRRSSRLAWGAALAVLGVGFVLSLARMPWASASLAIGVIGLLKYRKLPFVFLAFVVILVLAVPGVVSRVAELTNPESQRGYDVIGRINKWTSGLELFLQSPIIGNGLGAGEREAVIEATEGKNPGMLHSDYVRVLTDTGILGFIAFVWLLIALFRVGWQSFQRVQTPWFRGLAATFLGVCVAFVFIRATGNIATNMPVNFAIYSLAGAVWALPFVERSREEHADA